MSFADRVDAGRRLARRLEHLRGTDLVVLGLPRGGVPVAAEVARALEAPLDVIVVRKLGVPFQPELAMGAVGEGGVRVLNDDVLRTVHVRQEDLDAAEQVQRAEVEARSRRFRDGKAPLDRAGRTAVIVDDGIATGATARAACEVARAQGAARVVLAVPVAPPEVLRSFTGVADEVVVVETPARLYAIGQWYDDFSQTPDEQVVNLLHEAAARAAATSGGSAGGDLDVEVTVPSGELGLPGHLTVPAGASGLVAFAHGSGSSRHSSRNLYVAKVLTGAGLGTLLFDLLTLDEERDRGNVFDIELLARRLTDAVRWLQAQPETSRLPIGLFGASTGAAAALWAAAEPGIDVRAVVSRGGRPDLASPRLPAVDAPTLLIVGGRDETVLSLNREAQRELTVPSRLEVIPGATHLFEEPGALEQVAELARDWFAHHLPPR